MLDHLKRSGPATAQQLARTMRTSDVAVRQHLVALEASGLVQCRRGRAGRGDGRGRPSTRWTVTPAAERLFPDHHGELAVGLIEAIRRSEGESGLLRIIDTRARDQAEIEVFRAVLGPDIEVERTGHMLEQGHRCVYRINRPSREKRKNGKPRQAEPAAGGRAE